MTLVVGVACASGIGIALRWRTMVSWGKAMGIIVLFAVLQLAALRISFIPYVASH
jgi:hypothetical protein